MTLKREWVTPLLTGAFALMAVTGILMFFHLDRGLNKTAHEWLGWVMVVAVLLHVAISWFGFKRYFTQGRVARTVLAVSALVLAGSFVQLGEGGPAGNPPMLALRAVTAAPLAQVAPLTGRSVEQLVAELKAAGFAVQDGSQTLSAITGPDRGREARALGLLFGGGVGGGVGGGKGGPGPAGAPR